MSTKLNDFANQIAYALTLPPGEFSEETPGESVDLLDADGPAFVVLHVGSLPNETSVSVMLEESADGSTWEPIPEAEFTGIETENSTSVWPFTRSERYVRVTLDLAGSDPSATACIAIGQQKKVL